MKKYSLFVGFRFGRGMDGYFADDNEVSSLTDSESVIDMWENTGLIQEDEKNRKIPDVQTSPEPEPLNLLDPGLSGDDKVPEDSKKARDTTKPKDAKKPEDTNKTEGTKKAKDTIKEKEDEENELKPRNHSEYYKTVIKRIRKRDEDEATRWESVRELARAMDCSNVEVNKMLGDIPMSNEDISKIAHLVEEQKKPVDLELGMDPRFTRAKWPRKHMVGDIIQQWKEERQHVVRLRTMREVAEKMRNPEGGFLTDPLYKELVKDPKMAALGSGIFKEMEKIRAQGPGPVQDPRQDILDLDPRAAHQIDEMIMAEIEDQVPDVILDSEGYPPCAPPELKRKRKEIAAFQEQFNEQWAKELFNLKLDPMKEILKRYNPDLRDESKFPASLNSGDMISRSVEDIMNFVDHIDPAKCLELSRNVDMIDNPDFNIFREYEEKCFEKIVSDENELFGLHPNMFPEIRQKRMEVVQFQDAFNQKWVEDIYNKRQNPLRAMASRFNPALEDPKNFPSFPLQMDTKEFSRQYPYLESMLEFVGALDPAKVEILAKDPLLHNNSHFMNDLFRDEDEMNFEVYEDARRNYEVNKIYMEEIEEMERRCRGPTPSPHPGSCRGPPPRPFMGQPGLLMDPHPGPLMRPPQGPPRPPAGSLLPPLRGPSSQMSSSSILPPIKNDRPPAEMTVSETMIPVGMIGGSNPFAETGITKPIRGPLAPSAPFAPIGDCKSSPITGGRKPSLGPLAPIGGSEKGPKKSSLNVGPLAPIKGNVLSLDPGSMKPPLGPLAPINDPLAKAGGKKPPLGPL